MELVERQADMQNSFAQMRIGSKLMSPTIKLSGHQGDVLCSKFSKCGNYLASAGRDRLVLVWDIFDPQCRNLGACKGHKNAIIDLKWDVELED
jgi:Prp8 binding protein